MTVMKWSFKIATVAGTEVRIHVTFLILLAFVGLQGMSGGQGIAAGLDAVLFISAMFFCVLLHEFGHVFAARGYGIRTPDITLLPIGGLARLERMPRKPVHELVVAISGPLVNIIIAAIIWLALGFFPSNAEYAFEKSGHFWEKLMMWNILMVVFNMIPAFPMDGGRVLRAFLAMFLDYGRATRWAAHVGQGLALFAVLMLLTSSSMPKNPLYILIAFFIFMAAGQEAAAVTQEEATRGLKVRDAMLTEFHTLPPRATLRDAVDLLLAGTQHDFPVVDGEGNIVGILTRKKLIAALSDHGVGCEVIEVLDPCPAVTDPAMNLNEAVERLQATNCPALPVMDSLGRLIGLLTAENVGEALMVRAAMQQARQAGY